MKSTIQYQIYDEFGCIMRTTNRREEAKQIVGVRQGWSTKRVIVQKKMIDLTTFEDAPF